MRYLFSRAARSSGRSPELLVLEVSKEDIERWDRQSETPYEKLSDQEKASGLEEADQFLKLLFRYIRRHGFIGFLDKLSDEAAAQGDKHLSDYFHNVRRKVEDWHVV